MDSTAALELEEIPERLLVVGGGYIGLELGTVYAALGSQVTVVELTSGLLPGVDPDLVEPLARDLKRRFQEILLDTRVTDLEGVGDGIRVTLAGMDLQEPQRTFDKVLLAVGRRPNSHGLGLETTRVQVNPRGFIETDDQRRTAEPHIFAIGDVAGEPMLAHKATHEARVAVEAMAGQPARFDPQAIPAVVFTDPEIAWCGLTEAEARSRGAGGQGGTLPLGRLRPGHDYRPHGRPHEVNHRPHERADRGGRDCRRRGWRNDRGGGAGDRDGGARPRSGVDHARAPHALRDDHGGRGALLWAQSRTFSRAIKRASGEALRAGRASSRRCAPPP